MTNARDTVLDEKLKEASQELAEKFGECDAHFILMVLPTSGPQKDMLLTCTTLDYDAMPGIVRQYFAEPNGVDENGVVLGGSPEFLNRTLN